MLLRFSFSLLVLPLIMACGNIEEKKENAFLKIDGQAFVDQEGRQVMLSGINFISKNPEEKYMPAQGEETFRKFKEYGFNCIRFGIIWDALEPEPGKYNEEYLQEVDKRIQWATNNGLYVFLDMHQDLYGSKYADGAPEWATIDGGKPHYKGAVWSDSYLISPAVQTSFDNFWANTPASDGLGIQDHYANLWKHIAKRYANNSTVIGYDIMNEPFMGSEAQAVMPMMLGAFAKVYAETTGKMPPSAEELEAMWSTEDSRMEALKIVESRDKFSAVVDAVYDLSAAFETQKLQPFYQKVANAVREVNSKHILFLNHNYFVNTGVRTALEPLKLSDGSRDTLVAYAAHGYDLVVDTKEIGNPSTDRVEFIFDRIAESGKRLNMPILIGEWGALHGDAQNVSETAKHLVGVIEGHKFSNTFWAYYKDAEKSPYFKDVLVRPYPQRVSGKLIDYHYDFETGDFSCSWTENANSKEPSIIFVPNLKDISEDKIKESVGTKNVTFEYSESGSAGTIAIEPSGKSLKCEIKLNLK
ncbi:MAG: cellulase family glycosylhydrolase [Bacteroidales bacterium]